LRIAIQTVRLQEWFGNDILGVVDLIRRLDELGVHQVEAPDHIVMGHDISGYPYGKPRTSPPYPWFEPIALLSAIAAVTRRIRLSTAILISPLRPAPLLAKQLATLDHLSRGRVDIGVGTGWQRLEYDASSIGWDRRFSRMADQIRACKALWTQAPASHHGEFYSFDGAYCLPFPLQPQGLPIWFGLPPSGKNLDRMAELGDGWVATERRPDVLAADIQRIRDAMAARGRDPDRLQVRVVLAPERSDPRPLDALKRIADYAAVGVTTLSLNTHDYCARAEEIEDVFKAALTAAAA
jgi:probable F420-dependent oxidoreductase